MMLSTFRHGVQSLRVGVTALLALVLLAGCIGQEESEGQGFTPLDLAQVPTGTPPTPVGTPANTGVGGVTGVLPPTSAKTLDAAQLVTLQPNELGVVPVLMYHAFVTNPTDDEWTRTLGDFQNDLQWLYDNDYYIVTMRELLDNAISAPPGKHPVVLTFDDASARQFQFEKNAKGDLVPTADSAVGVMEAFFAKHPDFGHTSFFALLPFNCFSFEDVEYNTIDYCEEKLTWLADHGYEIGNHTWGHQDLSQANADEVISQIGQTMDFIDERVEGPANMSRVLVLPYGAIPDPEVDWWAWSAVYEGFVWNDEVIELEGVVNVTGGVMTSPASTEWNPLAISRFNTEPSQIDYWFGALVDGTLTPYTSDGNPQTVVVPSDEHDLLAEEFDPDMLELAGKTALIYDPKSGDLGVVHQSSDSVAQTRADGFTAWHRNRESAYDLVLR
ncbi:MAG: polysaccharide deacetylase family protein [Thermomicrobiales bacterium]